MSPTGKTRDRPVILLFDDDAAFAETWAKLLSRQGFSVITETDPHKVAKRIQRTHVDLVLLDIVVEKGDYNGVDVLMDIMTHSTDMRVIVFSGPSTREQVVTCIKRGACDFVSKEALSQKNGPSLLADRIRIALGTPQIQNNVVQLRENLIDSLWANIREGEPDLKGRRLEMLVKIIFESLPAFYEVRTNLRPKGEELDVVAAHENQNDVWRSFGSVVLVECKNWSGNRRPQTADFASFKEKLRTRSPIARLGFFVSLNGVTRGFETAVQRYNAEEERRAIVVIDERGLEELVQMTKGTDREHRLRQLVILSKTVR